MSEQGRNNSDGFASQSENSVGRGAKRAVGLGRQAAGKAYRAGSTAAGITKNAAQKITKAAETGIEAAGTVGGMAAGAAGTLGNVVAPGVGSAAGMAGGAVIHAGTAAAKAGVRTLGRSLSSLPSKLPVVGNLFSPRSAIDGVKKAVKLLFTIALSVIKKLLMIVGPILALFIFVLILVQLLFAGALVEIASLVETYAEASTDVKSKGYMSNLAGMNQEEFNRLVGEADYKDMDDLKAEKGLDKIRLIKDLTPEDTEGLGVIYSGVIPYDGSDPILKGKLEAENKVRNKKLDERTTDEERDRLKAYLTAERESVLKSPVPEEEGETSIVEKVLSFFQWGDKERGIERLVMKNHDPDFDIIENLVDIDPDDPPSVVEKKRRVIRELKGVRTHLETILNNIKLQPDNMKNIMDKMVDCERGKYPKVLDYPMEDKLYKLLEPHALSWKVLYFFDRAIGQQEFEDYLRYRKGDLTQEEIEEFRKEIMDAFMHHGIPKFMPKFRVERHMKEYYKHEWDTYWTTNEEGDPVKETDHDYEHYFEPVYVLVEADLWDKYIYTPYAERTYKESESRRNEDGTGSGYDIRVREPVLATSIGVEVYDPPCEVEESGGTTYKSCEYEKIVSTAEPDFRLKHDEVRQILKEIYDEDAYEIVLYCLELALNASTEVTSFYSARYDIATVLGLEMPGMYGSFNGVIPEDRRQFIEMYRGLANEIEQATGVPAAIILAQAILESNAGKNQPTDSNTGRVSNNLFGHKWIEAFEDCDYVECTTQEELPDGTWETQVATFMAYNSIEEGFWSHASKRFLLGSRYAPCMAVKDDPFEFARQLPLCGYASDSHYADKLINIMITCNLLAPYVDVGDGQLAWPLPAQHKNITSYFNEPRSNGPHGGIDIADSVTTQKALNRIFDVPIYAAESGTAYQYNQPDGAGTYITIQHNEHLSTMYFHLDRPADGLINARGKPVQRGEVIGYMGHTGHCIPEGPRGTHLHFEVRVDGTKVDPLKYVVQP